MNGLEDQIALAEKHVLAGRRIVARQRERIARGEVFGSAARDLLAAFEQTQEIFEDDLLRLLDLRTALPPRRSADPSGGKSSAGCLLGDRLLG